MDRHDDRVLAEIAQAVGRIEGQLKQLGELPARVEKLERWRSWLSGAWAVVAAICMYLWESRPKI